MSRYWAILIGVNQYQALQPLLYAQHDALGLYRFLVEEAGYSAEHCLLTTDATVAHSPAVSYPTQQTLLAQIQTLCREQLQADDFLLLFFSGYGLEFEGQDYLLMVDADPAQVKGTALSMKQLFELLKTAPTSRMLVALDMNRSQSALPNQQIGAQTLALAQDFGIPTLLSCQPGQFSHETLALRHGFFASALLEGLRYHGCVTLEQLAQYLGDRVPELSQHHWRPTQNPAAVIPKAAKFLLLLPPSAVANLPLTEAAAHTHQQVDADLGAGYLETPRTEQPHDANGAEGQAPIPTLAGNVPEVEPTGLPDSPEVTGTESPGKLGTTLSWAAAIAVLLFLGVVLRNRPVFMGTTPDAPPPSSPSASTPTAASTAGAPQPNPTGANPNDDKVPVLPNTLPPLPEAAREELARQANRALLDQAYGLTQTDQPSRYSDAIQQVRQIQPGEPLYDEAQQAMQKWSQAMLVQAVAQVQKGDLAGGIAIAQQVPQETPELHAEAKQTIAQWLKQVDNRRLIQIASEGLQADQASTYQKAIELVRQIEANQPEYAMAQQLANQWSIEILRIARARAAQGLFNRAIQAAELIPSGTTAYDSAQNDVRRWQGQ